MNEIDIALDYVSKHKNNNIENWLPFYLVGDEKCQFIYTNLINDVYGECRDNAEYNEDGDEVKPATEYEVEIPGYQTITGNPVIYQWEINNG